MGEWEASSLWQRDDTGWRAFGTGLFQASPASLTSSVRFYTPSIKRIYRANDSCIIKTLLRYTHVLFHVSVSCDTVLTEARKYLRRYCTVSLFSAFWADQCLLVILTFQNIAGCIYVWQFPFPNCYLKISPKTFDLFTHWLIYSCYGSIQFLIFPLFPFFQFTVKDYHLFSTNALFNCQNKHKLNWN